MYGDEIYDEYLDPNPDEISFEAFTYYYEKILLAIGNKQIKEAKVYYQKLQLYFDRVRDEAIRVDSWLKVRGVEDYNEFVAQYYSNQLNLSEIREFCRNTTFRSSLPYLEFILNNTDDTKLRIEANLAIQCIIRI